MNVDSGVVETVGPQKVGGAFEVKENTKAMSGFKYVVANGQEIPNMGRKHTQGYGGEWIPLNMRMQVTDVKKGASISGPDV